MPVAVVTGSSGLVGSETARFVHEKGLEVIGLDNDMRKYFFGAEASTAWNTERLKHDLKRFTHHDIDVRDQSAVFSLFEKYGGNIALVVHTAAQPSHDWAAREPVTDFTVNANGNWSCWRPRGNFRPTRPSSLRPQIRFMAILRISCRWLKCR